MQALVQREHRLVGEPPSALVARVLRPALCLVELLVHPLAAPPSEARRDDNEEASDQDQATAETVEGLVGPGPEVGAEPVAGLADAVGDGDERGLLTARGRDDCRLPGELEVETVVGTRDQDEEGEVADADVGDGDEEGATNGTEADGDHDVPEVLLATAGRPRAQTGECVREGIRRRLNEVGSELSKVEGVDDLWMIG